MRVGGFVSCVAAALLVVVSCDGEEEMEDAAADDAEMTERCPESTEDAFVTAENRTGSVMTTFTFRACDGSDLVTSPIPGEGLADGEDLTMELPKPGCWIMGYEGNGCFNEPKHQTAPMGVCGGDTHVWLADAEAHTGPGGGW